MKDDAVYNLGRFKEDMAELMNALPAAKRAKLGEKETDVGAFVNGTCKMLGECREMLAESKHADAPKMIDGIAAQLAE